MQASVSQYTETLSCDIGATKVDFSKELMVGCQHLDSRVVELGAPKEVHLRNIPQLGELCHTFIRYVFALTQRENFKSSKTRAGQMLKDWILLATLQAR